MKLIRYEKPEFGSSAFNRLEDWLRNGDRFFGRPGLSGLFDWDWNDSVFGTQSRLGADLYEDDDHYYARFELPGVKKSDVNIELHNAVLTVTYAKGAKEGEGESTERFTRSISVPDGVDADRISAKHEDGLLTVTMPKAEADKPRNINVS